MPIRLSGMQSGLDTEALVSALVMGYRTKKEDYENKKSMCNSISNYVINRMWKVIYRLS